MGWSWQHKEQSSKTIEEFICKKFNWKSGDFLLETLDSYCTANAVYLAVKRTEKDKSVIYAVVCLYECRGGHYNFGYKDIPETMLPYYYDCPDRILDILDPPENEDALKWRTRCREINTSRR